MWAWGLNLGRFLTPAWTWIPFAAAGLLLVAPLARVTGRALDRADRTPGRARDRADRIPGRGPADVVFPLAIAALVLALPDHLWFVGDFVQRAGTISSARGFIANYPQSLPLDLFLHDTLTRWLMRALGGDVLVASRLLCALEAALLAHLALRFARERELRGAAAFAVATLVIGGAALFLTGDPKSASEQWLLTTAIGVCGARLAQTGRGRMALAVLAALFLTLHRVALLALPPVLLAFALAERAPDDATRAPRAAWARALPLALPAFALLLIGPRIVGILRGFDLRHHVAPWVGSASLKGSNAHAMVIALADRIQAVLVLAPLSLALPALAIALGPGGGRRREGAVIAALAAACGSILAFTAPQQSVFRDLDVYAPAGAALSLLTAWLCTQVLRDRPASWLAPALLVGVAAPTLQGMAHAHDLARGLTRVRAFVTEAPPRADRDRFTTFEFLADRYAQLQRWDAAEWAAHEAVAIAPSPRLIKEEGMAATEAGHLEASRDAFRRLTARAPDDPFGWSRLAVVATRLGDRVEALRAADSLERLSPDDGTAREVRDYWTRAGVSSR